MVFEIRTQFDFNSSRIDLISISILIFLKIFASLVQVRDFSILIKPTVPAEEYRNLAAHLKGNHQKEKAVGFGDEA